MAEPPAELGGDRSSVTLLGHTWSVVWVVVVWCLFCGLVAMPVAQWAQARWDLPGVMLPLRDGLAYAVVLALAVLAWVQRRRRRAAQVGYQVTRRPLQLGRKDTDGCGAFLGVYLALMVLSAGAHGLQRSSQQRLDNMAPVVAKGETWVANRWSYRWHGPQIGDLVAFDWQWFQPGRPMQPYGLGRIVSLGGESLAWRDGRVVRTKEIVAEGFHDHEGRRLDDVVFVPQGSVAVLAEKPQSGDYSTSLWALMPPPPPPPPPPLVGKGPQPAPWSRPPETPFGVVKRDALAGKVVAVSQPFWRMRSVQ